MHTFVSTVALPYPVEAVFAWHEQPGALQALLPAFPRVSLLHHEGIRDGAHASIELNAGPFRMRWDAIHKDFIPNRQFRDVQVRGPFKKWIHTHRFEPIGESGCRLTDEVEFELYGGRLVNWLLGPFVALLLHGMFFERNRATERALGEFGAMKPCGV